MPEPDVYLREQLAGFPPPVARYFEFALRPGQPLVRRARIRHEGAFRARIDAPASRFTSIQNVSIDPPGFVWDAHIHMMPLVATLVRDSYIGGVGSLRGAVVGLVPVVNQHGSPSLARGALLRYLAEAVWYPTPLDESSARVTLADGPTTVTLEVHFGPRGEIVRLFAIRERDVNGVAVPTPWTAFHSDYQRVDGMMIPLEGEVRWDLPEGELTYWRGRIVDISYAR